MHMQRIFLLITIAIMLTSCGTSGPQTATPDAVRAFYVGLAALQVGDDPRAKDELTKATQLAANEPAAWANLGILQIRHKDFDAASQSLERARRLADKNPKIYETIALLEKQRGNFDAAQVNLQKAVEVDPNDVKALYALAEEKERETDDAAAFELYRRSVAIKPQNIAAKLDLVRLAGRRNELTVVRHVLGELAPTFEHMDPEFRSQFKLVATAADSSDTREVSVQIAYLRNVLLRHPGFRENINELKFSETTIGEPFTKPLVLQVPTSSPAPADASIHFDEAPIRIQSETGSKADIHWCKVGYLDADAKPIVAAGSVTETYLGDQKIQFAVEDENGLALFDFDYDFKTDAAFAGPKGFRLFRQTDDGFTDVTSQTTLPTEVLSAHLLGVWVLDVESDGDLDLILGRPGLPATVLQNNSDGKFSSLSVFDQPDIVYFASADLDEDGDADVVGLGAGKRLHYFKNERGGIFRRGEVPETTEGFDIGDVNGDGQLEIVTLQSGGVIRVYARYSESDTRLEWQSRELFRDPSLSSDYIPKLADFDNNGALDIALIGREQSRIWLHGADGKFQQVSQPTARICSIIDTNNDGRLDVVGVTTSGKLSFLDNRGTKNYNWQTVRPRAQKATGDQRVNSFGIGGELELRSGLLLQKQLITEPVVHFGLGENPSADVLRVVWQNGFVQAEFDLKPNQPIEAQQRLKGSCPHLFAFNGEKFAHVKDAPPWSPALGLKINAQDTFGILETEEWFKVPGESLKPTKDGFYELRITGEYWESFYLDRYSLLVVDHPENTEVFTDERFSVPPPPLEVFTTGNTREFASAMNDKGDDVTATVKAVDEKYLDGFERGTFQGVAKDHYVEVELPSDAPADKRVAIIADGFLHPTDASINVQLGQSSKEPPRSLSLEVRDQSGEWKVAKENLGFPAGKMKTVIIEVPLGTRAARLRTNMEIFWDRLSWGVYEKGDENKTTRLELAVSDLRYRGFSVIEKKDDSSPEIPHYDRLLTTTQRWRDMEGYFTRFGDVRELLTGSDDRVVLMNAGDELVLKFPSMPAPPAGYKRDFVLIGDGWIKDGDLNSVFSKTLLPLPTHVSNDYSRPPTTLENDPVYQKHKADWLNYHTRYVSPDGVRNALR